MRKGGFGPFFLRRTVSPGGRVGVFAPQIESKNAWGGDLPQTLSLPCPNGFSSSKVPNQ